MTNSIEIKKSLTVKTQTMEKRTNTDPNKTLSTNVSLEVSKDEVSKNKIQGCLIVIQIIKVIKSYHSTS
jgi:hypothetical protein